MGKYAVLISTGNTQIDDVMLHSEYWYDLILMYRTLIENGFSHDNIFVLYGAGNDFNSNHSDYNAATLYPNLNQITNYPVSEQNVEDIFSWLAAGNPVEGIPAITNNDFLFVWWMGHGNQIGPCQIELRIAHTDEDVADSDFATYVNHIQNYLKRAFVFMTCHSGGMFDDLQGATTIVETAVDCNTLASSDTYDVVHAEFTYYVACGLREIDPMGVQIASDVDNNNLVSMEECFIYATNQMVHTVPQINDISNIAPCTFIRLPTPGKIVEIMSRDHVHDNGITPSNYEEWYHGPDLWVRNLPDDIVEHQNLIYGQQNYIYANIHNIGCATATNTNIKFSWCLQTAWANPAFWNDIGNTIIPTLGSLQNIMVKIPWNDLPVPGTYCLHTRLNCAEDPENQHGEAYKDNNKVQINIDIVDSTCGLNKKFLFFIENASKSEEPIDIEINATKKLKKAQIRLVIPKEIQFKKIKNANVKQDRTGDVIVDISNEKTIIKAISLEPNSKERKRLLLSVSTPNASINERSTITIEERVRGELVGGIKFVSKISDFKIVVRNLLIRKYNLFKGLMKELELEIPTEVLTHSRRLLKKRKCEDKKRFINGLKVVAESEEKLFNTKKVQEMCNISEILKKSYNNALMYMKVSLGKRNVIKALEAGEETLLYMSALLADYIEKRDIDKKL